VAYALEIGRRYLRSKKRKTISVITFISVTGVALGVAALLAVLSITSGFEREFRDKVLGVNAHVLVMKYGVDFDEYRDVVDQAQALPEVAGAGPFLINPMMLAHGERLSGVLVKGIDPDLVAGVLDLPDQLIAGTLEGLRHPDAEPASSGNDNDDDWLREMVAEHNAQVAGGDEPNETDEGVDGPNENEGENGEAAYEVLPTLEVVSPEDVEALLQGFDPDEFDLPDDDFVEPEGEDPIDVSSLAGVIIGVTLAENLEVEVGDTVRLVSPLSGMDVSLFDSETRAPRTKDFVVIGIFEAGFQEYDANLVYADLYEAQHFYGQGDVVTGVEMRLHDLNESGEIARQLERELGGPFHTVDWAELNRNLFTALKIQKISLGFVIATIIFVAAFNVIATLIMVVLEKKREIAILKAMGATDSTILGIFVVQGVVIGVIGTAIGLLLGGGLVSYLGLVEFPLDPKVYLIDHLPVVIDGSEFVITATVAILICTLATIAPSMWAARMLPVDGLRNE
jgi:lipoprotein-releasing system permease protein